MPKYKCKKCGAVWYGWAKQDICKKCGGKLELVPERSFLDQGCGSKRKSKKISNQI